MPRPRCRRRLGMLHGPRRFKPQGIPTRMLQEVVLTRDELEAIRLSDFEGLYQEQASGQMGISRSTFARIITEARKKVADALVSGKVLRIGDEPVPGEIWSFHCPACGHSWEQSEPQPDSENCPDCGAIPEMWTPQRPSQWRRRGRGGGHGGRDDRE